MIYDLNQNLVQALEEILPSLSIWQNATDRRITLDRIRLLCQTDPVGCLDCLDQAFENLRTRYSVDHLSSTRAMLEDQGEDCFASNPSIFLGDECEEEFQLYGVGFLASGLTNESLARDCLTEEDARKFREILYKHWFDEEVCEISVFEALTQINHRLCQDMGLAWNFLRDFEARRAPLVPVIDRPDYPDYTADPYIDENNAAYNADMRVIIFGVRFPRHSIARPVMKKPYGHIGRFPCDPGKNDRFIPDLLMETEYGRDMSKMLSALGDFRWNVTEPLPFFQALVQTDHSLAPRKLLTCVTRLLMDTGLSLDDIIASPATFVDRFSNYAEMRVAFADKKNPDKLLAGCPLTVPYLEDEDRSGYDNWYAYYTREIRRLLIMNNISTIPLDEFTSRNETEPENVDRLYRSSTGKICHIERPAEAFEEFPTIPSCSRFN